MATLITAYNPALALLSTLSNSAQQNLALTSLTWRTAASDPLFGMKRSPSLVRQRAPLVSSLWAQDAQSLLASASHSDGTNDAGIVPGVSFKEPMGDNTLVKFGNHVVVMYHFCDTTLPTLLLDNPVAGLEFIYFALNPDYPISVSSKQIAQRREFLDANGEFSGNIREAIRYIIDPTGASLNEVGGEPTLMGEDSLVQFGYSLVPVEMFRDTTLPTLMMDYPQHGIELVSFALNPDYPLSPRAKSLFQQEYGFLDQDGKLAGNIREAIQYIVRGRRI